MEDPKEREGEDRPVGPAEGPDGSSRLRAGVRVGEYLLVRRMGAGAFGEVWEGRHEVFGDRVAVKIPRDAEVVESLRREGVIQRRLQDPHIVRVRGISLAADPPYVITDLVDGESLRARIDRGPLPLPEALSVLHDVALGLACAHRAGVLHRDLKPSNVLLDREGRALLADFGLGHALDAATRSLAISIDRDSAPREIAGTLDYMSPEQRRGDSLDERADVYAFGIVLFETLTGVRPAAAELPSERVAGLPPAIDALYRACCAGQDARLRTMDAVLERLAPLAGGKTPPTETPGTADRAAPPATPLLLSYRGPLPAEAPAETPAEETHFCDRCGARLPAGALHCDVCGAIPGRSPLERARDPIAFCDRCGLRVPVDAPFCEGCGGELGYAGPNGGSPSVSGFCDECGTRVGEPTSTCCERCGAALVRPGTVTPAPLPEGEGGKCGRQR